VPDASRIGYAGMRVVFLRKLPACLIAKRLTNCTRAPGLIEDLSPRDTDGHRLSKVPGVQTVRLEKGKLSIYEEFPDQVANEVRGVLDV
jgi:hypothetical protein